ncbi:hypothetical protein DVH05_004638 [Phytophthora capsici]|nr:hypothetical protein DVH05_004638 [Phytophthora capsici]
MEHVVAREDDEGVVTLLMPVLQVDVTQTDHAPDGLGVGTLSYRKSVLLPHNDLVIIDPDLESGAPINVALHMKEGKQVDRQIVASV